MVSLSSIRNALDIAVFSHKITQVIPNITGDTWDIPAISDARSELVCISFTIVTDATVDNRRLRIYIKEGAFYFRIATSPTLQPASTSRSYIIGQHGALTPETSTDKIVYIPVPSIPMLMEGNTIRLLLLNGHSDIWSALGHCFKYWVYEQ